MTYIPPKYFTFIDTSGVLRIIRGVSLKRRRDLHAVLVQIEKTVEDSKAKTVSDLYENYEFRAIADKALELAGISTDWIDIDIFRSLLFPREIDEQPRAGLLQEINFPPTEPGQKMAGYEEAIASLWNATGTISEALKVAGYAPEETLSASEIGKVAQYRAEQIGPEFKAKRQVAESPPSTDLYGKGKPLSDTDMDYVKALMR